MQTSAPISPQDAAERLRDGAVLVDIRETEECETVISGALHAPLSTLDEAKITAPEGKPVIFHCRSGGRTAMYAQRLCAATDASEIYLLEGGITNWTACGLPVVERA